MLRDAEIIKVPILRSIFVRSFYGNFGRIVSYASKVTLKNTDKKASKIGTLIISASLSLPNNISVKLPFPLKGDFTKY